MDAPRSHEALSLAGSPFTAAPSAESSNEAACAEASLNERARETASHPLPEGIDRAALEREVAEAMTGIDMNSVAAQSDAAPTDRVYAPGDLVRGRIQSCTPRDVLIDLGGKVQGVIPRDDFLPGYEPPAGLELNVLVDGVDAATGLVKLSKKRADTAAMWRDLKVGDIVSGIVSGMNKGGLEVAVGGIRAFIPASQVDTHFVKDITELFGKTIRGEVMKIERDHENLVISRRKVMEREAAEARANLMADIKAGEVRRGRVRAVTEYGAFIDLGGVDGLLHVTDMSWGRVARASDVVKVHDEVEVRVLKVQPDKGKISLGLKQLRPHPWENIQERYSTGATVKGRVVRHADFGTFVELEPGVDGLVPLSELSWNPRVRHPREVVQEGDVVDVAVLSVDPDKKRISLSLRQLADDPWKDAALRFPVGQRFKVKVLRTAQFGAFVEVAPGVEAMIHISELSPQRARAVEDVVKPGLEVEARVLKVDPEGRKIGLSLRPEPAPPPESKPDPRTAAPAAAPPRKKTPSKPRRGGIDFGWDSALKLDPSKYAR